MAISPGVNLLLLIELAAVVIGASAFLFYWNRLLGSVTAFLIRLYIWRYYNAYVIIGSLQISPLAGRISYRDVEYHSSNLSVRALHGHVTWRYWKLRIRGEADSQSNNVKRNKLPCRITIYAEGVEAFVYNRTPAYDAIVERMKKHEKEENEGKQSYRASDETVADQGSRARLRKIVKTSTRGSSTQPSNENTHQSHEYPPNPTTDLPVTAKPVKASATDGVDWFREALPLDVRIVTGSVVLGSDATPMILIGDFKRAEGTLEVTESRSSLDLYKMAVNLTFRQASVLMRTNVDYSGPLLAHGKKLYDELLKREPNVANQLPSAISVLTGFRALAKRFAFLYDPKFSTPPVAGMPTDKIWKGLARYRMQEETNTPKQPHREEREYAKVTNLLETPQLDFTYFADTPGRVPELSEAPFIDEFDEIGNVDLPPEYGIDIVVHKGNIRYGPWADRQRDALQRAFAPSLFFDSEPKERLKPGDTRVHGTLVLHLLLEDETTLRIPTREPSKDWQFDNNAADAERRYGWLDVVVGPNSLISYTQSQVATKHGYDSMLVLQLDSLGISSSVNLDTFIKAKSCKLSMTMPTPLQWNAKRDWGMDVTLDAPNISLLRDHVTLISDLSRDWSAGTTGGDYHHFVPNHYNFRVSLINYAFHLYINDFNIVDAPWSRDSNAFVDAYGPRMDAFVAVASTQYRPETSIVPFTINISGAKAELCVPKWDTHRAFGPDVFEVGKAGDLVVSGSYRYYSSPNPEHQETLILHLEGKRVIFKALGWVIRRMFCVKDNYFGGFTQFKTMQEYLERFDHDPEAVGDPVEEKYRPGRSDAFSVFVTMNVEESLILMSDEIYNCKRGVIMPIPQMQMNLKSTAYFMELSLDFMPTYVVAAKDLDVVYKQGITSGFQHEDAIFIEGIELKANRLFGPEPHATTYLCLWEAVIPKISAFLTPEFLSTLQAVSRTFGYTFNDVDNAPAEIYVPKTPPDVTFFKLSIDQAVVLLTSGVAGISIDATEGVSLDTSTWATRSYSSMLATLLPSLTINLLRRERRRSTWESAGSLQAGLNLDVYKAPVGWQDKVSKQQEFLRKEDGETGRIWYMYSNIQPSVSRHVNGVYLPRPMQEDSSHLFEDETETSVDYPSEEMRPPSSADSTETESQFDFLSTGQPRRRRRARSFMTARETATADHSSLDDESDTVSDTVSSIPSDASGDVAEHPDMAIALAAKLRSLHRTQHHREDEFTTEPQTPMPESIPTSSRTMPHGTVTKLSVTKLDICISPAAASVLAQLKSCLSQTDTDFERRLDALLDAQVDAIADEKTIPRPKMFDLRFPSVTFRTLTDLPQSQSSPGPSIITRFAGVAANVYKYDPPDEPAILEVASTVQTLVVSAVNGIGTPTTSLYDIPDLPIRDTIGVPYFQLAFDGLSVGIHIGQNMRIHSKVAKSETNLVTGAVNCLSSFADTWQSALAKLDLSKTESIEKISSDAQMLKSILEAATAVGKVTYFPTFAYERTYGLHVQDERNIRRQTGWWLLARFREWLRSAPPDKDRHSEQTLSPEDITEYVIDQLYKAEDTVSGGEHLVKDLHFVRSVFGTLAGSDNKAKNKRDPPVEIFLYTDSISLRHHGRLLNSNTLASSSFAISSASIGISKSEMYFQDRPVTQIRCVVAIKDIQSTIHDNLFAIAQAGLRKIPESSSFKSSTDAEKDVTPQPAVSASLLVVSTQVESIDIGVIAGGLRLHMGTRQLQIASVVRKSARLHVPEAHHSSKETLNATCSQCDITLYQPTDEHAIITNSSDRVVIGLQAEGLKALADKHASTRHPGPEEVKVVLGAKSFDFESHPQLKAFHAFIQDRKEHVLPIYAPAVRDLQAQWNRLRPPPKAAAEREIVLTSLDFNLESARIQVKAARNLSVKWDIGKIFVSRQGTTDACRFAIKIAPQVVGAYLSAKRSKPADSSTIRLPSITVIGDHRSEAGRLHVAANIDLGFFTGVLKPAILDRLLSLHQQLGADIAEVIQDWQGDYNKVLDRRRAKTVSVVSTDSTPSTPSQSAARMAFNVHVGIAGIRFGLRADDVTTTLLFEALAIKGFATNESNSDNALSWRASVNHFGLSLGHLGTQNLSDDAEPIRKHRTAYMVFDLDAQEMPPTAHSTSQLSISLSRVHTVMHVEALSELSDLVRSWTSDLHVLRDHRSAEVAEVKVHTTRVLKKLESAEKVEHSDVSWFANRLVSVEVSGVGIAIPLVEGAAIGERERTQVPALLYSIRVISFHNKRNETARFRVQNMALQFVKRFDQSSPEHFTGDFHESSNRMTLPSIESKAQMLSTSDTWQLSAHCSATDFKLSLAPDIVDGIFKLVDLFHHGRDRISSLEEHYRSERLKHPPESVSAKYEDPTSPTTPRHAQRILVRMSFTFNSGIVELYRELSESERKTLSAEPKRSRGWHDTVVLPTVSVWMDHAGPKMYVSDEEDDSALLLFNFAVHESRNLLRPSILPFFVQIVKRMENRAKADRASPSASTVARKPSMNPDSIAPPATSPRHAANPIRLRVTLRIDKSEMRLSCAPDSNAYADLKWESGGFLATATIGGGESTSTVAGTVSGVTAYLRHEFAEEGRSCIEAGAKDIAFSIAYCPSNPSGQKGLSIVLDSQISAQFRLEQFSAWLSFAAVWIDNAPKIDLPPKSVLVEHATIPPPSTTTNSSAPANPMAHSNPPKLAIAALVRFRNIDFDVNVGVTNTRLEMTPIVLRTLSNGEKTEVDLQLGVSQITARGDISGEIKSDKLSFRTTRRSTRASVTSDPTVLSMSIVAGDLTGSLFLQELNVICFHLEPATVTLADDWQSSPNDSTSMVSLAFAVKAGVFRSVIRLLSVPSLLNKLNSITSTVESQERVASQRSSAYKRHKLRKSTEPSPMTAVLLHTAHKAGQSLTSMASIKTAQTMNFDLGGLDIGLFNTSLTEDRKDFYRFVMGKVQADLKRQSDYQDRPERDLSLLVSFVRWDTSDGTKAARDVEKFNNLKEMIEIAASRNKRGVASLPLMIMKMNSTEESPKLIVYDFDVAWGEGDGDIAIYPSFYEQAIDTFQALIKDLDKEQVIKAKRRGLDRRGSVSTTRPKKEEESNSISNSNSKNDTDSARKPEDMPFGKLVFRSRHTGQRPLPVPRLRLLGEATGETMNWIPQINAASEQLPVLLHRFVTSPLEDGMDLLLKLYEKQLPDQA